MKDHLGLILIVIGSVILLFVSRHRTKKFKADLEKKERQIFQKRSDRPLL